MKHSALPNWFCRRPYDSRYRLAGLSAWLLLAVVLSSGCRNVGPQHDRPFPLGQASDAHWETQQTNAEAADFVFYDHEFVGDTAKLAPGAKRHLEQVALRIEHVPFPIVVEESLTAQQPELDEARRQTIVEQLARIGILDAGRRVVVSSAFAEGFTGYEGEQAYQRTLYSRFSNGGGSGRRFGGRGGAYR